MDSSEFYAKQCFACFFFLFRFVKYYIFDTSGLWEYGAHI